jgi:PAS domain S-box-containing protein
VNSPLRILYLEDDPRDAELVLAQLEADGFASHLTRVENQIDFCASLEQGGFDLILADYTLPSFNGISALKIAVEKRPDVPFIFVSGTLDEEIAIEALKIGATDYVFKTRLSRIVPALQRALREGQARAERKLTQKALRRSEAYLAEAQRLSHTGSFGWILSTGELFWSDETFRIFQYDRTTTPTVELALRRTHPEDVAFVSRTIEHASRDRKDFDFEHRLLMPDGSVKHVRIVARVLSGESEGIEFVGAVMDITSAKESEATLRRSEGYLAEAQRLSHTGSWARDAVTDEMRYSSEEFYRVLGFDPHDGPPVFETFLQRVHPDDQAEVREIVENARIEKAEYEMEYRIIHPSGEIREMHVIAHPVLSPSGDLLEFIGTVMDVTERRRAGARAIWRKRRGSATRAVGRGYLRPARSSTCPKNATVSWVLIRTEAKRETKCSFRACIRMIKAEFGKPSRRQAVRKQSSNWITESFISVARSEISTSWAIPFSAHPAISLNS